MQIPVLQFKSIYNPIRTGRARLRRITVHLALEDILEILSLLSYLLRHMYIEFHFIRIKTGNSDAIPTCNLIVVPPSITIVLIERMCYMIEISVLCTVTYAA